MNTKYPALMALIAILASEAKSMAAPSGTLLQKLENSIGIVPQVIAFMPQASLLGSEIAVLKANPSDEVACAEQLVNDLGFSSPKAVAIIASAYPVAEAMAAMIPSVEALVKSVRA